MIAYAPHHDTPVLRDARGFRQCKAHARRLGRRCRAPAMRGTDYCRKHGGHAHRSRSAKNLLLKNIRLPRFYKRYLTQTLNEVIEEMTSLAPAEQLQMYEELALLRDAAAMHVQLYSVAREGLERIISTDGIESERAKAMRQVLVGAAEQMRSQLLSVISVGESAARIEANARDKVSVLSLHHFVDQVVRCAHEAFGGDHEGITRAKVFDEMLRTSIRLPPVPDSGSNLSPTSLTPDATPDVMAMDDTVPRAPGDATPQDDDQEDDELPMDSTEDA
jgi:hypothetical protein